MDFIAARKLVLALILSALAIAIIGAIAFSGDVIRLLLSTIIVLALIAAAIIILFKFCRCKNCGKVPVNGLMTVEYCPRCKHSMITGKTKKQEKKDRK